MPGHLYAILSDIHANYSALLAAARDARAQARREQLPPPIFVCLGDIVDYGPQPNQCMTWVVNNTPKPFRLRGNHDAEASLEGKERWTKPNRVPQEYWPISLWTRLTLTPEHRAALHDYPEHARGQNSLGPFLLFHAYPPNGSSLYNDTRIDDTGNAGSALALLTSLGFRYGLFGHTHFQTLFAQRGDKDNTVDVKFAQPEGHAPDAESLAVNQWRLLPASPALINAGSVGQPRAAAAQESDNRAAYLLLDTTRSDAVRYQWRRVSYAVEETIKALQRMRDQPWPAAASSASNGNGNTVLKNGAAKHAGESPSSPYYLLNEAERAALQREFPSVVEKMITMLSQGR